MENLNTKIPDQKLKIGTIMVIISYAVSICWSIIYAIIILNVTNVLDKIITIIYKHPTSDQILMFKAVIVVFSIISIVISSLFIWWATNILKGKTKDGKTLGIIITVLSSLSLLSVYSTWSLISLITLIISGVSLAAGILLIMGKFLSESQNSILTTNDSPPIQP